MIWNHFPVGLNFSVADFSEETKRECWKLALSALAAVDAEQYAEMKLYDLCTEGHDKIHLSGREFQMMEMLMTSPGRIISVDNFMDRIWSDGEADVNVVWVYISNLRKKLSSLEATCEIKASRGVGYSINEIS